MFSKLCILLQLQILFPDAYLLVYLCIYILQGDQTSHFKLLLKQNVSSHVLLT